MLAPLALRPKRRAGTNVDPADIRNRIGNGEIEVVAGGVE
jgi:hypothetical protein